MASACHNEVCQVDSAVTDCPDGFKLDVVSLATDESAWEASFKTTSMESLPKVQLEEPGLEGAAALGAESLVGPDGAAALEQWRARREERRARLARHRARFGSQAHGGFCRMLCSSDCRHCDDHHSMFQ